MPMKLQMSGFGVIQQVMRLTLKIRGQGFLFAGILHKISRARFGWKIQNRGYNVLFISFLKFFIR